MKSSRKSTVFGIAVRRIKKNKFVFLVCLLYKRARPRPFIYINAIVIKMSLFAG